MNYCFAQFIADDCSTLCPTLCYCASGRLRTANGLEPCFRGIGNADDCDAKDRLVSANAVEYSGHV